jgi:hypothetical protein
MTPSRIPSSCKARHPSLVTKDVCLFSAPNVVRGLRYDWSLSVLVMYESTRGVNTNSEKRDRSAAIALGSGLGKCSDTMRRNAWSSLYCDGMVGGVWKNPVVELDGSIVALEDQRDGEMRRPRHKIR